MLFVLVLGAVGLAAAACGSSGKSDVCARRDDVKSSVDALLKVNPTTTSISDIQSKLGDLQDSTKALAKAAGNQYKPQVDALQTSTTALTDGLKSLGSSPSASAIAAIPGQVSAVASDANALLDAVGTSCD